MADKYSAVVLAAGSGKRMGLDVKKQYMEMFGKPLLFYTLEAFEKSDVDEIIVVTAAEDVSYVKEEIIEHFGFQKVSSITIGGKERYHSVYEGLKKCSGDYVLIHDGARAFVTEEIISRAMEGAKKYKAAVVGMPSKDTVKISDDDGFVLETPDRSNVWVIQTPQAFELQLVKKAYEDILKGDTTGVTDDAMVVEKMTDQKVKFIEGSYDNIKVTTKEDIFIGENILKKQNRC